MIGRKTLFAPLLFAVIATVLIFSWFRDGLLYGGGDVGIPSYNPARIYEIAKVVWWTNSAPGTTVPQGLTSVPFQFAQSLFSKAGLSYVHIQAVFFWTVIFLTGYGMFLMAGTIFGRERKWLSVAAGLFYQFNPYMMIEVWHRFIHTTFFLMAALPFLFIFWSKWIKRGAFLSLLIFLLISFLSSYMFGTLAFIVVILFLFFWIAVVEIILPWKDSANFKRILFRFFLGIFFWFLIQTWWMLPSFSIAPAVLYSQHSIEGSLSTLLSISEQTIVPYSLFGINPFYLYSIADFGSIYNSPYFRLIPFLVLFFLFPGFAKSLKNKTFSSFGQLFILGLFLAKGAASPFGNMYIFGFSNIFPLGVLRNPFEKMGILIPFSGAILFSLGLDFYVQNKKFKKKCFVILGIILTFLFVIFQWPLLNGKLFGTVQKPAFVEVPSTYIEADQYIKNQKKTGNILHLPLSQGESANYYWKYGFNGVESSQLYFNSLPSISRGFNIAHIDDALSALSGIFSTPFTDEDRMIDLLRAFNVRFIVLHKDMEWRGGSLTNPEVLEQVLNSKKFLKKEKIFGNLIIYSLNESDFAPKLRLVDNPLYINPGKENSYWPWLIKNSKGDFISPLDKMSDENLTDQSREIIIVPKEVYSYSESSVSAKTAIDVLAQTKILPGESLYFLISLGERIKLFLMSQNERPLYKLTLAGKRLVEIFRQKEKKPDYNIVPLLQNYRRSLNQLDDLRAANLSADAVFPRHISILNFLISNLSGREKEEALKSKTLLTDIMESVNLLPHFGMKENNDLSKMNRRISDFQIPYGANYEVLMALQNGNDFYKDALMKNIFQIDDSIQTLKGFVKDHFISFGNFEFTSGLHEISFSSELSKNMFSDAGEGKVFEIDPQTKNPSYFDFEIDPVTGGGWYRLSFKSLIKEGNEFKVQLMQDSDSPDYNSEDKQYMSFNKKFPKSWQKKEWSEYSENLNIRPATTKARVRFLSLGKVSFKDIEIKRVLMNPLFLRVSLPKIEKQEKDTLEFQQKNPISYTGKISIKSPKFLIFAESFHKGWLLKLNDGKREISLSPQYAANLYSNGWFLEKGDYIFTLEFEPQQLVRKGVLITGGAFFSILVFVLLERFKKI